MLFAKKGEILSASTLLCLSCTLSFPAGINPFKNMSIRSIFSSSLLQETQGDYESNKTGDVEQLSIVTSNSVQQNVDLPVNSQEGASFASDEQAVTKGDESIAHGLILVCRVCEAVIKASQKYLLCSQHKKRFEAMQKNCTETGERLQKIMEEKNLNQKELVKSTNLSISTISRFIIGKGGTCIDTLETICVVGLQIPKNQRLREKLREEAPNPL